MDTKINFDNIISAKLVYVRPAAASDLPDDEREQARNIDELYAVCSVEGEQLAVVSNREMAFVLAWQNDFAPVSVH